MSSIMKPTRLPESQAAFEQLKKLGKQRRTPPKKTITIQLRLDIYEKLTAIKNKDASHDNEYSVVRAAINEYIAKHGS